MKIFVVLNKNRYLDFKYRQRFSKNDVFFNFLMPRSELVTKLINTIFVIIEICK